MCDTAALDAALHSKSGLPKSVSEEWAGRVSGRAARINNQTEIVNGERILYFQSVPTRSLFSLVG